MSIDKHTPGPWKFEQNGHDHNLWGDGHAGRVLTIRDGVIPMNSDARLIAAAPELLEHLQTLADYLAEAHAEDKAADHYGDEDCSYCRALDHARAAIARATGEPVAD